MFSSLDSRHPARSPSSCSGHILSVLSLLGRLGLPGQLSLLHGAGGCGDLGAKSEANKGERPTQIRRSPPLGLLSSGCIMSLLLVFSFVIFSFFHTLHFKVYVFNTLNTGYWYDK